MALNVDWGTSSINSTLALGRDSYGNATYAPAGGSSTGVSASTQTSSGGVSGGEAFQVGSAVLSNILSGIAKYQAAKENYSILRKNYANAQKAQEINIKNLRQQNEMRAAENRTRIAMSGIKSDSFADVMQSNKIIEENDIAVMRANLREQMYADLFQAVKDKYKAHKSAAFGTAGSIVGAIAGGIAGGPAGASAGASAGGQLGSAIGGI